MIKQYFYLAQWFIRARFFGRRAPLQTVLFITDKCNLRCKHFTEAQATVSASLTTYWRI